MKRKLFLEAIKEKSIQKRFKDIIEKPLKRKFIQFECGKYSNLCQFGIIARIEKPDKEMLEYGYEYECYHGHIFIDFGKYFLQITFMDYN